MLVDGTVAGSAAATGTSYRVGTAGVAPGRHLVRTRIAGRSVLSNPLVLVVDTAGPRVTRLRATPNPFNLNRARVARVLLHVDEASDVQLSILRSGRVVKTLGSRSLTPAGNVVLTWNATDNGNRLVGAGRYGVRAIGRDPAGNRTAARTTIQVIR